MREMGVYDNTRIIVVSDHGYNMWNIPDLWVSDDNDAEWLNPLLLVKDFGDNEPLRVSDEFMTTGDVPTIVMEGLIEDPVNPFTGNPVNSDVDKTQQLATTAHDSWDIRNYSKTDTQFNLSDGSFWRVDGNVHDVTKWERVQ